MAAPLFYIRLKISPPSFQNTIAFPAPCPYNRDILLTADGGFHGPIDSEAHHKTQ